MVGHTYLWSRNNLHPFFLITIVHKRWTSFVICCYATKYVQPWGHMQFSIRTHTTISKDTCMLKHITRWSRNGGGSWCRRHGVNHSHFCGFFWIPLVRIFQYIVATDFSFGHGQVTDIVRFDDTNPLQVVFKSEIVEVLIVTGWQKVSVESSAIKHEDAWLQTWGHNHIVIRTHAYKREDTRFYCTLVGITQPCVFSTCPQLAIVLWFS